MDYYKLTDTSIVKQIGLKIKELRIAKEMKQQELSEASGVSVFTISAVENGKGASLLIIIQLLRALEKLDYLDYFFQNPTISPVAYAKLLKGNKKKERVRLSKTDKKIKEESEW